MSSFSEMCESEGCPATWQAASDRPQKRNSTQTRTWHQIGGEWQTPRRGRFTIRNETPHLLYGRLGGPGCIGKTSPPPGSNSYRPTHSDSLYRPFINVCPSVIEKMGHSWLANGTGRQICRCHQTVFHQIYCNESSIVTDRIRMICVYVCTAL